MVNKDEGSELQCSHCKFSFFYVNDEGELEEGSCHRYPPMVYVELPESKRGLLTSIFPEVYEDDWCGEFQKDEETTKQ